MGANREERRKVGPADTATRNRLLAEALSGTKKPRDTSGTTAGSKPATKPAKPPKKPKSDVSAGADKLLRPKGNIERALASMEE